MFLRTKSRFYWIEIIFRNKLSTFSRKICLKYSCICHMYLTMGLWNGAWNIRSADFLFHFGNHFAPVAAAGSLHRASWVVEDAVSLVSPCVITEHRLRAVKEKFCEFSNSFKTWIQIENFYIGQAYLLLDEFCSRQHFWHR